MLATMSKVQSPVIQPIIEPDHNVLVLPADKYGMFKLPKERVPIELPLQTINVGNPTDATSGSIASLPVNGQPASKTYEVTDMDMEPNDLMQLRFIVVDPRVRIELDQPNANSKYNNTGTGQLYWTQSNTVPYVRQQMWGMLPEAFIMGNTNRIVLKAYNMDPDESTDLARVMFFGYKYQLTPIDEQEAGGVYTTVSVGAVRN